MNRRPVPLLVALLAMVSSTPVHAQGQSENAPGYIKTSGILKEFSDPFMLREEQLKRITTAVLKARDKLGAPSEFFFYVHREDDRFYEVESLSEVLSDPNARGSRVVYFTWNLLQDINPNDDSKKPYRILWAKYSAKTGVELRIDGKDMDWALLTADELESEIKRTLYRGINYPNVLIVILGAVAYFLAARLTARIFLATKFKHKATEVVIDLNLIMLLQFPPMLVILQSVMRLDSVLAWFRCSRSYFLWGDMLQDYHSAAALSSNLLWVVLVGLIVTVAGNVITDRLLKKREAATENAGGGQTDEENREQQHAAGAPMKTAKE